jgi:hypothetical protein
MSHSFIDYGNLQLVLRWSCMLVHLCVDYCTDFLPLEIADYDTEAGGEGS